MDRINRLQEDKSELLENMEEMQQDKRMTEDRMREVYDRLLEIRGVGGLSVTQQMNTGGKNIVDMVERKCEDLARLLSEMESDNLELTEKNKKLHDALSQRE